MGDDRMVSIVLPRPQVEAQPFFGRASVRRLLNNKNFPSNRDVC